MQYHPFITDELVEAVDSMDPVDIWPESWLIIICNYLREIVHQISIGVMNNRLMR